MKKKMNNEEQFYKKNNTSPHISHVTNPPKISVALAVYNTKAEYLRECIDSILQQTYTNFELIIINDASTVPHIDECVHSYTDPRIRYYTNEYNLGIADTRNKLLSLAQGEYIAICDHDDIHFPTRFEKQVACLDTNPEIGVVGNNGIRFVHGKEEPYIFPEFNLEITTGIVGRGEAIHHATAMFRKQLLIDNAITYEKKFFPSEDFALWARLVPYTQFYNIQEVLFIYREHTTNTCITAGKNISHAMEEINSFSRTKNPELYLVSILQEAKKTRLIRLFGIIPFLRIKYTEDKYIRVYLFYIIEILKISRV